jgi:hypothetical protein
VKVSAARLCSVVAFVLALCAAMAAHGWTDIAGVTWTWPVPLCLAVAFLALRDLV